MIFPSAESEGFMKAHFYMFHVLQYYLCAIVKRETYKN